MTMPIHPMSTAAPSGYHSAYYLEQRDRSAAQVFGKREAQDDIADSDKKRQSPGSWLFPPSPSSTTPAPSREFTNSQTNISGFSHRYNGYSEPLNRPSAPSAAVTPFNAGRLGFVPHRSFHRDHASQTVQRQDIPRAPLPAPRLLNRSDRKIVPPRKVTGRDSIGSITSILYGAFPDMHYLPAEPRMAPYTGLPPWRDSPAGHALYALSMGRIRLLMDGKPFWHLELFSSRAYYGHVHPIESRAPPLCTHLTLLGGIQLSVIELLSVRVFVSRRIGN